MQTPGAVINKFVVILLITLLGYTTAKGAEPVVHVSAKPTWLTTCKPYNQKPSLRTVEGGYFFELVEHQEQVEQQAAYHHFIRQIVSEAGIQNGSEISISFDPAFERLDFHKIIVWRNNKPLNRLKPSAFKVLADEKDLSDFIYQGTYSALYILDDIRKGDRIEYSYTITGRNPIFQNKFCANLYLQYYQTIEHQYTSLIFSDHRKMNVKSFNGVSAPKISKSSGLTRYEWEDFQIKPALYDENEPSWYDGRAHVQVSDYSTWGEVVNWAMRINPVKTGIKGELAAQIAKLKTAAGNDKEKYFRVAVKTVQDEVRYMGIEIGQYSHRANDPEKVFNQRYGDCKDKSLLLVSMLQAGGIDANMVLINTDMTGRTDQLIPASNDFNHAVVVATLNGKQVWVDATIDYQRGTGTNIWFPDYGEGLILKPGNNGLTTIPASPKGLITCEEKFVAKNEKKPVDFIVTTTYTLNQADKIRDRLASSGMAETEKNYLSYYAKTYSKIEAKDSIAVIDDEQKNVLTTIEKYKINDYFKKDSTSGKFDANFYADCIKQELPSITNQTKTPIDVSYPFDEDYTIKVILPAGWNVPADHKEIKRDAYRFTSDYTAAGDTLSLNYKFAYLKEFVPFEKLDEFKQDIKKLSDDYLDYGIDIPADGVTNSASTLNQWMLNFALFIVLIVGVAGVLIYRIETPGILFSYGNTFVPLGGWLILIVIGLFLTPITGVINLIDTKYFNIAVWDKFGTYSYGTALKARMIFAVAGHVILICYAVFCLVLMLNRRDIFKKYIIGYLAYCLLFNLANFVFIALVTHYKIPSTYPKATLYAFIYAAIWIPYFLRSTRVEETFIVPYPSYNYRYEAAPVKNEQI